MNDVRRVIPVRTLVVIMGVIAAFAVTIGLASPLISLILEARGESAATIGLMTAVPSIGTLAIAIYLPRLLNRFGMRRIILVCLVVEMLAFIAMPEFTSLAAWYFIRLIMGATGAGLFIAAETWINTLSTNEIRGRITAIYGIVTGLSFALGPMIVAWFGTGRIAFWAGAVFVFLALVLTLVFKEEPPPATKGKTRFGVLSFILIAPVVTAAIFLAAWKEVTVMGLLPVYAVRAGLDTAQAAGLVAAFAIGVIAFQYPVGWASDRINRYIVLGVCGAGMVLGAALLPWMISTPYAFLTVAIWGGVSSGLYSMPMAIVGDRFQGAELATAMSCFGILWAAGNFVGPLVSGQSMEIFSNNGLPATLAVAGSAFVILLVLRRNLMASPEADKPDDSP